MSKKDVVSREDARCLAYRAHSSALVKGTLRGIREDATLWINVSVAEEVMLRGLFNTPLV